MYADIACQGNKTNPQKPWRQTKRRSEEHPVRAVLIIIKSSAGYLSEISTVMTSDLKLHRKVMAECRK